MVFANDGQKIRAAIAPTFELSARLQAAARDNRRLKQSELDFAELQTLLEERLAYISEEMQDVERTSDSDEKQKRLGELEESKNRVYAELEQRQGSVDELWLRMRQALLPILDMIDDIHVRCRLLDPPVNRTDPELEDEDAGSADESSVQYTNDPEAVIAKETSTQRELVRSDSRNDIDHSSLVERAVINDYYAAKFKLRQAAREFDDRLDRYDNQAEVFKSLRASGDASCSTTQFGLKSVARRQRLTKELIEAEADLKKAKAKAIDAGVDVKDEDQSNGFVDDTGDGYRTSMEAEIARTVNRDRIQVWLDTVPGIPDFELTLINVPLGEVHAEIDEWDAKSVEVWESGSMRAEGTERRHIDKWRTKYMTVA